MATSDFLNLPSGANLSISTTSESLPPWFQSYMAGLISKASSIAGQPYQPYPFQRLAGFNGDQTGSFDIVRNNLFSGANMIGSGGDMIQSGGSGSSVGAADPFYNSALNYKATSAAAPWLQQTGNISPTQMAYPAVQGSMQQFPSAVPEYMSPYIDNAVNRMADVTTRNFNENIAPNLNATFTGAGTFGGSRHFDFMNRAVRDLNNEISGNAAQMYDAGYGRAADIFSADKSRMLSAGLGYGQLGTGEMGALTNAGALASNATQADANLLGQIGTSRGQLAAGDFSRMIDAGGRMGGLGQLYQDSILKDAAALGTVGQQVQGQQQQGLDLGYSDWMQQQQYPLQMLQLMNGIIRGFNPGSTTTSIGSQPQQSTSPLATLLGLGIGASQLGNLFGTGNTQT